MGGLRARLDVEGVGVPFLLALLSVLGVLQLLDAFGVVYFPMVHRATRAVRFEIGFSLVLPLVLLFVLWLGWVFWMRRFEALLFPAMAVLVYPFLGLEASISVAYLLSVVAGLWFRRDFGRFFYWVLVLLSGLEATAFAHAGV
jgi:hypothetical protein